MNGASQEVPNLIFPEIADMNHANKGLLEMLKYLCNKVFNNFGWEVCRRDTLNENITHNHGSFISKSSILGGFQKISKPKL